MNEPQSQSRLSFPLILVAAVVQGWALYGLHLAIKDHHWPATDHAWLFALYAVAVFIPATVQVLADFSRSIALWLILAMMAAALFYFGWHHGAHVDVDTSEPSVGAADHTETVLVFSVLWLLSIPFIQSRLALGRWRTQYPQLFANAWRNKLVLAEAALFTGLFWLLLLLWETLFHMLKIEFFRELFEKPIFVYPVTALAFGCAIHLVGSVERLTALVLEQLLNVLKWLATLAGAILVLFTVALLFKLPGLLFKDEKAIGATWLLWLLAVMILLLNAAYRDGTVAQPYPSWVARSVRWVVPFMVVVSLTALHALYLRSSVYGITVERYWAFVVAGMTLLYSVGYSRSAMGAGTWLAGMAGINVSAAVVLIVVLAASLTPILSPYRLAANSQYALVRAKGLAALSDNSQYKWELSPLSYLRFEAGDYGRVRLAELAKDQHGVDADSIRRTASALLTQKNRFENRTEIDVPAMLTKLRIYPAGRVLDSSLIEAIKADSRNSSYRFQLQNSPDNIVGLFIDLNQDGAEEFVLLTSLGGFLYRNAAGQWTHSGTLQSPAVPNGIQGVPDGAQALERGDFRSDRPKWNDLAIGVQIYRVYPNK